MTPALSELPQARLCLLSVFLYSSALLQGLGGSAGVWEPRHSFCLSPKNALTDPASFWAVCAQKGRALFPGGDGLPGQGLLSQGMCLEGFVPKDLSHRCIQLWIQAQSQRCLRDFPASQQCESTKTPRNPWNLIILGYLPPWRCNSCLCLCHTCHNQAKASAFGDLKSLEGWEVWGTFCRRERWNPSGITQGEQTQQIPAAEPVWECGEEANLCVSASLCPCNGSAGWLLSGICSLGWIWVTEMDEFKRSQWKLGEISNHFLPSLLPVASILAAFQDCRAAPAQSVALLEAKPVNL